jgi:hypothetical protein
MSDTRNRDDPEAGDAGEAPRTSLVMLIVLSAVFAILYAYPLFEGISNLIALPPYYQQIGIGGAVPWYLLVIGVIAPPALYAGAVLIGRGRELFARALILAVGLAATNALALSLVQWAQAVQPALT